MMNILRKIWRNSSRRFLGYFLLFFLGVFTCLLCLQVLQLNFPSFPDDLNDSPFYYNLPGDSPCDPLGLKPLRKPKWKSHDLPESNPGASYYEEAFSQPVEREQQLLTTHQKLPAINNLHSLDPHRTSINLSRFGRQIESNLDEAGKEVGPTLWIVTPTFYRPEQKPELTRLAQALLPVRHFIHWIIIDDIAQGSENSLKDLENFLERFPLSFTLLKSVTPPEKVKIVGKPRGVGGRRAAIAWLRQTAKEGVVYFADDDNTYDSDIFRQMQHTEKVSMWPVGLVTSFGVSSPIVKNGEVVGFYDGWNGLRKFPVDMAGFAINMKMFLKKPKGNMPYVAGYEEDELLRTLGVSVHEIHPLANNCTQILVWHTKTTRNPWPTRPKNLKPEIESNTNLKELLEVLPQRAHAGPASSTKTLQNDENFSLLKFFFGGT